MSNLDFVRLLNEKGDIKVLKWVAFNLDYRLPSVARQEPDGYYKDEYYNVFELLSRINKAIELLNEYKDICIMTSLNDDTYKTTPLYEDLKEVLRGENKKWK